MLDLTGFLTRAPVASATFQNLRSQPECPLCKMCSIGLFFIVYLAHTQLLLQRRAANTTFPLQKSLLSLWPILNSSVLALSWHLLGTNLLALVPWPQVLHYIYISSNTPCMWLRALWRLFCFVLFWPDLCLHTPIGWMCGQVFNRFWVFPFTKIFHL